MKRRRQQRTREREYFRIGTVARMLSVHPQTLRLYEREGLIQPLRSAHNVRLYTREDVRRAAYILWLTRDLGVNLAGVEIILEMQERMRAMQEEMIQLLEALREEVIHRLGSRTGGSTQERSSNHASGSNDIQGPGGHC